MQLAVLLVAALWAVPLADGARFHTYYEEDSRRCVPGTTYKIYCQTCQCSDEGYTLACSREECTHSADCEEKECSRQKIDYEDDDDVAAVCVPGISHQICKTCKCDSKGTYLGCYKNDCKLSKACTDIECSLVKPRHGDEWGNHEIDADDDEEEATGAVRKNKNPHVFASSQQPHCAGSRRCVMRPPGSLTPRSFSRDLIADRETMRLTGLADVEMKPASRINLEGIEHSNMTLAARMNVEGMADKNMSLAPRMNIEGPTTQKKQ